MCGSKSSLDVFEKSLFLIPAGVRTPDRLARSPVAIPTHRSCFINVRFLYIIVKLYRLLEYGASNYCGVSK